MKFEKLHTTRNKKIVIGIIVFSVIVITLVFSGTKAKYRVTQSIPLVRGAISYSPDDIIIETYINNILEDNFPIKGTVKFSNISCTKDAIATFNEDTWSIRIANLGTKGTKCSLYFTNNLGSTGKYILADKTINERTDFTSPLTDNTTGTIFRTEDDDGITYYYAGASMDNWFYFGGYYWRIVRINGDGTLRMIYQGSEANTTGNSTQLAQTSAFNATQNDNTYEGYMYGNIGASDYGSTHTNTNDSTIKGIIDNWYNNNLVNYSQYIDESAGFCGERKVSSIPYGSHGVLGYGDNATVYAPAERVWDSNWNYLSTLKPTFKCSNENDLYTINNSTKGNKALTVPIGLISIDEIIYAGAFGGQSNNKFYLYTGQNYWTMSPGNYDGTGARLFKLDSIGDYNCEYANTSLGIRPVINLKADLDLDGKGSILNPYVIKGEPKPVLDGAKGYILSNKIVDVRDNFDSPLTTDTTGTVFMLEDNDGTSYYYAGNPSDNWVKFGGYYWRIIRINGDGTIRMIYQGPSTSSTGTDAQIGTSAFNSSEGDAIYVGYMYEKDVVHGTSNNSTIKGAVDNWYKNNLSNYSNYIDTNAGFCNDREPSTDRNSSNGQGGKGTIFSYFGAYYRLYKNVGNSPTFKCKNNSDIFTISTANVGNKSLIYPVGLITGDEVWAAGAIFTLDNIDYYLYTGQSYWTMTPWYYYSGLYYVSVLSVGPKGGFNGVNFWASIDTAGVRPVINLKADIKLSGTGTSSDPYLVKGAE